MTVQKIMVPFLDEKSGKASFEASCVLADRFKAHLDVVHMRQRTAPALPSNAYYPIAATYVLENAEALETAANERAEKLKEQYQRLCRNFNVGYFDEADHTEDKGATAAWADVDASMPHDLANRARLADITVLSKSGEETTAFDLETIEEVIFQSGRAVLLIDRDRPMTEIPETVLVAWNGGREATRAISSALPLLKEAKDVIVASIGDLPWGAEPPEHVASYLRLHGVHATHLNGQVNKGVEPEEEFLARAAKKKADLIVMGAYSHSRWREVILGGFTRHLLKNSPVSLLITH